METIVCGKCGSDNIQLRMWVDNKAFIDDNDVIDKGKIDTCDDENCYCRDCGEISKSETV